MSGLTESVARFAAQLDPVVRANSDAWSALDAAAQSADEHLRVRGALLELLCERLAGADGAAADRPRRAVVDVTQFFEAHRPEPIDWRAAAAIGTAGGLPQALVEVAVRESPPGPAAPSGRPEEYVDVARRLHPGEHVFFVDGRIVAHAVSLQEALAGLASTEGMAGSPLVHVEP